VGTLTLEGFRAELLFDLKNRTDTTTPEGLSVARQDMFINAGYLWVTHPTVFRHRELQHSYTLALSTPVPGTTNVYLFTPAPGNVVITGLRYVSHVDAATDDPTAFRTKLFPKDEQWFQERTLTAGGPPRDFAVRGNNLLISPVPGTGEVGEVLVVGAWREPAVLVGGATTVLSTLWDEIVVLAARWRAEFHLGYRDLAEGTKLDLVGLVNEYQDFERLQGEDWDWVSEVRVERTMESA